MAKKAPAAPAQKRAPRDLALRKVESASAARTVASPDAEHLDHEETHLLKQALLRGTEACDIMTGALVGYGRWLLVNVFDDDAAAALQGRRENKVWSALLARAGGPTLRLSQHMLYVALHLAAHDKRIQDESWRLLDAGRKELLLPLREETAMRKAAQHVVEMKLSQRATRSYVGGLLRAEGRERELRMTPARAAAQVLRWTQAVGDAQRRRKVAAQLGKLDAAERGRVKKELAALRKALGELLSGL